MLSCNFFASIEFEATVVLIVNTVVLILFVVAGVRQIKQDQED